MGSLLTSKPAPLYGFAENRMDVFWKAPDGSLMDTWWNGSAWVDKATDDTMRELNDAARGDFLADIAWVGANAIAIYPDDTLRWQYGAGGQVNSSPAVGSDGTISGTPEAPVSAASYEVTATKAGYGAAPPQTVTVPPGNRDLLLQLRRPLVELVSLSFTPTTVPSR